MEVPEQIVLVDKPTGMTSFDVIRVLRKKTNIKKWGHAGTLDPLATGLMVLAHDSGTKLLKNFIKLDKEYIAEVLVGERRSTGDMEGMVIEEAEVGVISEADISATLEDMIGTLTLPVSAYSAIKKEGVAMYKRARKAEKTGEVVDDVPIREMKVYEADILSTKKLIIHDKKRFLIRIRFKVGSGTYIRSLAEELGRRLGYPATLRNLRRTKVGEFCIEDASTLEDFAV